MSDLAERIRESVATKVSRDVGRSAPCYRAESQAECAEILCDNAPAILAAIEEREKLREALKETLETLIGIPSVLMREDEDRVEQAITVVKAALQPTPEQDKET